MERNVDEPRGIPIGQFIAKAAWKAAAQVLDGSQIAPDIAVFDREGHVVGRWGQVFNHAPLPRNLRRYVLS